MVLMFSNSGKDILFTEAQSKYLDFFDRFFMNSIRKKTIELLELNENQKLLDAGCGPGGLAIRIKKLFGKIRIFGVDHSEPALRIARQNAKKENLEINFQNQAIEKLKYKTNTFDRVVCSFVIHHIAFSNRKKTFSELYRVLKPKGVLVIVDVGKPSNIFGKILVSIIFSFAIKKKEEWEQLTQHLEINGLIGSIKSAGFKNSRLVERKFGFVDFFVAMK